MFGSAFPPCLDQGNSGHNTLHLGIICFALGVLLNAVLGP